MDRILHFLTKDLVDKAIKEIDKNGIPPNREGTKYGVSINGKKYPYKLIVTEAAKLVGIKITSNDFSSNQNNRNGFKELTGYTIIDVNKKIVFKNLKELINIINTDLGEFCLKFQKTKKELFNKKRMNTPNKLFVFSDDNRDWAINEGGGIEMQYHIFVRNNILGYGLGFNTQYVPFANEFSPIEYMKPFVNSFLAQKDVQQELQNNSFDFIIGDINDLVNLENNKYILLGKQTELPQQESQYSLDYSFYLNILSDIKGILFKSYISVVEKRNYYINYSISMQNKIELLLNKKQIILQGPPGTGKTRLAKQMAKELTKPNDDFDIFNLLKVGIKIPNASGTPNYYKILKINEKNIEIQSDRSQVWKPTFKNILKKYNELSKGITPSNKAQFEPYELAVAKYLFDNFNTENNYRIIQFHPSYTYEDFVRGITVKSGENGLEYITENKVLAKIAQEAQQNYLNSKKDSSEINYENWLEEQFEEFKDLIEEEIANKEKYPLTDKVSIVTVGQRYFKYSGNNWNDYIKYSSLLLLFKNNTFERKEIKKLLNINARATYYAKLSEKFNTFLENKIKPNTSETKIALKNYVLIIDEINRANLSSVLGELIYALEYRGEAVDSMYEIEGVGNKIILPENLYIIGTMNTADRSVGQIDYAIRRRFAFVDVLPEELNETTLEDDLKFNTEKFNEVKTLFENYITDEFNLKDVQLGHSYFIHEEGKFDLKLKYEIKPILQEYVQDGILKETALNNIENL